MTYELAKTLKDAGFPQNLNPGNGEGFVYEGDHPKGPGVYCPTLSELIEACGSDFYELKNLTFGWIANADSDYLKRGDGSTPEEAVARLWLALNKK
jgi:hypothetical protein